MLTLTEAQDFVDRWFAEHQAEIGELIDLGMAEVSGDSLGEVVGHAVSVGIGITSMSMVALIHENNLRWEGKLRKAGVDLR